MRAALLLWMMFILICIIVPPMFYLPTNGSEPEAQMSEGSPAAPERVLILEDNMDAMLWRIRLIESAESSLIMSTFEFSNGESSDDIMAAMYHAADRGVQVRILVDGLSGFRNLNGNRYFQKLAGHPNVEARLYNPIHIFMPWRLNYRMHDKYLIADGNAYILGGRNTGDLFLGDYTDSCNIDLDVLVYEAEPGRGTSYIQLAEYFERVWNLPCCKPYKGWGIGTEELASHYLSLCERYPEAFTVPDWMNATQETEGITLLSGETAPGNKRPILWKKLVDSMREEQDSIIITPYVICSSDMYHDLEALSQNGTKIRFLINAPGNGANPFGCTDYMNQKKKVLATGVSVCEYWGTQSLHTKAVLAGKETTIIGSCNADIRSVYLDTELMLAIKSEQINKELRAYADEMMSQGVTVLPDGTEQPGGSYFGEKVPMGKKIFYGILRVLIIPVRHLL